MALPRFFLQGISENNSRVDFDEAAFRHMVQVLRIGEGEKVDVTNGAGTVLTVELDGIQKKTASGRVVSSLVVPAPSNITCVGISLVKNASRFEWFLEKAAELGISRVVPLLCERTERQHFRSDRLRGILQSAMLQSQQAWLTGLDEPTPFGEAVKLNFSHRYIAHCEEGTDALMVSRISTDSSSIVLIGPEGDFSPTEISLARANGFKDLSLGGTRLRTETAGVVAATFLKVS